MKKISITNEKINVLTSITLMALFNFLFWERNTYLII